MNGWPEDVLVLVLLVLAVVVPLGVMSGLHYLAGDPAALESDDVRLLRANLQAYVAQVDADAAAARRQFAPTRLTRPAHAHDWLPVTSSVTGELLARLCPSCGLSEYVAPGDRLTA